MKAKVDKGQDQFLNFLKGFCIILVVFGHAIQSASLDFDSKPIFRLIYSFHMPLFIFLSGAVASYSKRPLNIDFIKNKAITLLVPFMAWAFLGYFLTSSYNEMSLFRHLRHTIALPDTGLWFLAVLFWFSCILYLFSRAAKVMGTAGYLVVVFLVYAVPTSRFGVGLVKWHLPFFFAGYVIFKYATVLAKYKKVVLLLCALIFPLLVTTWYRTKNPQFAEWIAPRLAARNVSAITVGEALTLNNYQLIITIYKYVVGFTGIGAVFFWMRYLYAMRPLRDALTYLSGYTLDIYAMSNYCLFLGFGGYWMYSVTATIAGVFLPVVLSLVFVRRVSILRRLLLGGR